MAELIGFPRTLFASLVLTLAMTAPSQAAFIQYAGTFTAEGGPGATGTGTGSLMIDSGLLTMRVVADFSGLSGTVTAAHVHCCTAVAGVAPVGVATVLPTFTGFPSGVNAGTYDFTYDMTDASSFNPTFVTNNGGTATSAFNALLAGLDAGKAYFNIHTSTFPGGEIRSFLPAVPEPATSAMLLLGLILVGGRTAHRRRGVARTE